ncbi:MAG: 30S ribosomal protein S4 [Gemmatimonadaceae bacterium]|jgi:small subunit ribosomal protein S4|nr:30S ribosomal protein S4 [Gemmatimonadaceae bacterium]
MRRTPRLKLLRRFGTPLPGLTRKEVPAPVDMPGPRRGRRKTSEYKRLLEEKQKLRVNYGVSERQLRNSLAMAKRLPGRTGEQLLALLERRLDSVVFRFGFAPTIRAARQLVRHRHLQVDGRRVDLPGFLVQPGQRVSIAPTSRALAVVQEATARGPLVRLPSFLVLDPDDAMSGRVISAPAPSDTPLLVDIRQVVEFYAR